MESDKDKLITDLSRYFTLSLHMPYNQNFFYIDKDKKSKCFICNKEAKLVLSHSFAQKWFLNDKPLFSFDYMSDRYFLDNSRIGMFYKNNSYCFEQNKDNLKEKKRKEKLFDRYTDKYKFKSNYENQNIFKFDFLINNFVFSNFILLCTNCENQFSEKECNLDFDYDKELNHDLIYGNIKRFLLFYKYLKIKYEVFLNNQNNHNFQISKFKKYNKNQKNKNKKMQQFILKAVDSSNDTNRDNTIFTNILKFDQLQYSLQLNNISNQYDLMYFIKNNIHFFEFHTELFIESRKNQQFCYASKLQKRGYKSLKLFHRQILLFEQDLKQKKFTYLEIKIPQDFSYFGFSIVNFKNENIFYLSIPKFNKFYEFYVFFEEKNKFKFQEIKNYGANDIVCNLILKSIIINSVGSYEKNKIETLVKQRYL